MSAPNIKILLRLGFEYGSPWIRALFAVLGLLTVFAFSLVGVELLIGFITGDGIQGVATDSPSALLMVGLTFNFYGAYTLRAVIWGTRLRRYFKRTTTVAEYGVPASLTAVEAGYLIDESWGRAEFDSAICELLMAGNIDQRDRQLILNQTGPKPNYYQSVLLTELFQGRQAVAWPEATQSYGAVSAQTAEVVRQRLVHDGFMTESVFRKLLTRLFHASFYVVTFLLIMTALSSIGGNLPDHSETRFVVDGKTALVALVSLLPVAGLLADGFFRKLGHRKPGSIASWRSVAGFKLYLEVVYKDRLAPQNLAALDKQSLGYLPYAVAFQIVSPDVLKRLPLRS